MNNNQSIQNIYESQKKSLQRKIFNFLPRIFNFPLISGKKQIAKRKRRKKEHKIKYSKNTFHRFTYNTTTITTTITTTAFRQKKIHSHFFNLQQNRFLIVASKFVRFPRVRASNESRSLFAFPSNLDPRVLEFVPANIAILGADCIIRAGISAGNLVWQRARLTERRIGSAIVVLHSWSDAMLLMARLFCFVARRFRDVWLAFWTG